MLTSNRTSGTGAQAGIGDNVAKNIDGAYL